MPAMELSIDRLPVEEYFISFIHEGARETLARQVNVLH